MIIYLIPYLAVAQPGALFQLKYGQNYTPTYDEVIGMYQLLDANYENAVLLKQGSTDSGKPLHLFIINDEKEFDAEAIKAKGKAVLLINNGIHAGEPAGIDASLQFADELLRNVEGKASLLEDVVVLIIPVYSIGGHLNRSAYHRSGQTTPYETGFRGNAANYDLNRDFVKCDSENAKTITKIFRDWDPDVFLDTHTTNGSEHQYSLTLIAPQPDKFPPIMENFLRSTMIPGLFSEMKKGEYELIPYVSWMYRDPGRGIKMTQESPRYSSGFAAMFHTYGMMTENHVYKPYPDRVKSVHQFIHVLYQFTANHAKEIMVSREKGKAETLKAKTHAISFELDTIQYRMIEFKGYEVDPNQISPITGLPRFGYDKTKPYTRQVRYFDSYNPVSEIAIPEYYILPQAYQEVIERLQLAGVKYYTLKRDTALKVEVDYIEDYSTPKQPSNGHYFHQQVTTKSDAQIIKYYAGDLLIPVRQEKIKFLLETLEVLAPDSYFRWNFFDNILDTREYYSSYGFEENAMKYLKGNPEFEKEFMEKCQTDSTLINNHRAQLGYIYHNTEWAEITHKRYPVTRIREKLPDEQLQLLIE